MASIPAGKRPAPRKTAPAKKPATVKKVVGKVAPARKTASPAAKKKIAAGASVASATARIYPQSHDREKAASAILAEIAAGMSLRVACAQPGMPTTTAFMRWLAEENEEGERLREQYARARARQAEAIAEELLEIADEKCVTVQHDEAGQVEVKFDSALVQDKRLRVDTRKWLLSKLAPKKYGDKTTTEHTGADGGPIQARIAVEFVKPPARGKGDDE